VRWLRLGDEKSLPGIHELWNGQGEIVLVVGDNLSL
jgi:hypothetical protein